MDPISRSIPDEAWRREQCVADDIKLKVLRVFVGLESLVDQDHDLEPEQRDGRVDTVFDHASLTESYNCDQRRNHSIPKWSELKRLRDIQKSSKLSHQNVEDSSPSTQSILSSKDQSDAIVNDGTKISFRRLRNSSTTVVRSNPEGDKNLQCPMAEEAMMHTGHEDPSDSTRPCDAAEAQSTPRAGEPAAADTIRADAGARRGAARRVRFAAQLEQDPPAKLHSPRPSRAGGRGAFAARILRAVSRSFTETLRRVPS